MRKPRPFSLNPIYAVPDRPVGASVRRAFAAGRRQRQGGGRPQLSVPLLLSLLLILVAVLLLIAFAS